MDPNLPRKRARCPRAASGRGNTQARTGAVNGGPPSPPTRTRSSKGADMPENYRKDPEAISRLSKDQYRVTQKNATEPAFRNEFWDNKEPGIYVDIVSGEPLFASVNKYDSGSGWPSFTVPIERGNVVEKKDIGLGMIRTEVRSAH